MELIELVFPYAVFIGGVVGGLAVLMWADIDAVRSKDDI